MSIMISNDKKELVVNCKCGCTNTIHIKVNDSDKDYYAFMTYLNGDWCRKQTIKTKLKKIWAVVKNKDFYYSDVLMSCDDFKKFKDYINQF